MLFSYFIKSGYRVFVLEKNYNGYIKNSQEVYIRKSKYTGKSDFVELLDMDNKGNTRYIKTSLKNIPKSCIWMYKQDNNNKKIDFNKTYELYNVKYKKIFSYS